MGHTNADGHQYLPRMLETLQAKIVKQVAACGFHTAALTESGEVFTWGEGNPDAADEIFVWWLYQFSSAGVCSPLGISKLYVEQFLKVRCESF